MNATANKCRICRRQLDSKCTLLLSEATGLPTVPQPPMLVCLLLVLHTSYKTYLRQNYLQNILHQRLLILLLLLVPLFCENDDDDGYGGDDQSKLRNTKDIEGAERKKMADSTFKDDKGEGYRSLLMPKWKQ